MQLRRTVFFILFLLLISLPVVSGAASSPKSGALGICCANDILKNSTRTKCEQNKGVFYSSKERAKAQKECRSKSGNVPGKAAILPKKTVSGFCCAKGSVRKTSQAQCSKMKGSYHKSSAEARKACKEKDLFCCIDGKISERSSTECKKRKGIAYKTAAEAKKKCKPADVYCCVGGKIKKSSPKLCKQKKGTAYKNATEAKRKCKSADVYCCVNGAVRKMSPKQCDSRKATAYKTKLEANKECRKAKNSKKGHVSQRMGGAASSLKTHAGVNDVPTKLGKTPAKSFGSRIARDGYCCNDRKVSQKSQKECKHTQGVYFKSRINAEKACRVQKAGAVAITGKSGRTSQFEQGARAKTGVRATVATGMVTAAMATVAVANNKVGSVEVSRIEGSGVKPALEAVRTCNVSGWVAVNGLAPTMPVSLRLTAVGNSGQARPLTFRLPLDGAFSLVVVEGMYRLEPLFPNVSGQGEGMSIAANEFICQPDYIAEISSTFSFPESSSGSETPPPMCAVAGSVSNASGTGIHEVTGLVVSSTSSGAEKATVYNSTTGSYGVNVPAGSSYKITAQFREGSKLTTVENSFTIAPEQTAKPVNVMIERAEQFCQVSGSILVDGATPIEQLRVNVSPASGGQPQHLMSSGPFSFRVPEGSYNIEPLFPLGSIYGEGIPAKQFICQTDLAEEVSIDFDYISPPVCVLSGRANGVRTLTLRSLAPDGETTNVSIRDKEFSVAIPSGASYILTPNIRGGAVEADAEEFTIYPSQRSHVVNFDRNQEGFRLGRLQVTGFDKSRQIDSLNGMVKFSIETLASGSEGRYNRSVRITSFQNPDVDMFRNCSFSQSGKCEFSLYLNGFNLETDSILAEIIDFEDETYGRHHYRTPFQGLGGDLRPSKYFIIKDGDKTISLFGVRNISASSNSAACRMDVRLGGGRSHSYQVPALAAGEEHIIKYTSRSWEPRIGNVLSFQVDNSCDGYSYNNQFSHTVTREQYYDASSDEEPDYYGSGVVELLTNAGEGARLVLNGRAVSLLFDYLSDFVY